MLELFRYDFMVHAFEAGTIVAVVAGAIGYFVVLRGSAFAAHALSHIGFAGATGAVVLGLSPIVGLLVFTVGSGVAIGALGNTANPQTEPAEYSRQSDVIYGRKFGLALTMEVIAPVKRSGLGVVWVVSSSGTSSREQTLQPSFERRVTPLLLHGYTVFAIVHGSSPAFQKRNAHHAVPCRRGA